MTLRWKLHFQKHRTPITSFDKTCYIEACIYNPAMEALITYCIKTSSFFHCCLLKRIASSVNIWRILKVGMERVRVSAAYTVSLFSTILNIHQMHHVTTSSFSFLLLTKFPHIPLRIPSCNRAWSVLPNKDQFSFSISSSTISMLWAGWEINLSDL